MTSNLKLKAPYLPGYWMEPSEIVGVCCTLLGGDVKACQFETPTSYVPFAHFIRNQTNQGVCNVWIVNTSIEGTHWVLVFFETLPDSKRIWVADPMGQTTPYSNKMVAFIRELVHDVTADVFYLDWQVCIYITL